MIREPKVVPLSTVTTWMSGGTPNRATPSYWGGDIPWISAASLKRTLISDSDQYLTAGGVRAGSKMAPAGATLVLVRGMALHRETRIGMASRPVSFNQDVKALVPMRGLLPAFLLYSLQGRSAQIRGLVSSAGSGTGVLNTQLLQRLPIWLPDEHVQREIVAVLSDADELIAALERLIAKKKAIEHGMLQQLLSGKTRLPSFTERWRAVRLRDAGATYGGLSGKTKDDFGRGAASFVTFMEVIEGARLEGRRLERVRVRPTERQNRVERGDVLFNGSSETPEEVALSAVVDFDPSATTYLNSFCFGYRLKRRDLIDPTYLAYFFRSGGGRALVSSLAQGATRYNIAKTKLLEVSPVLPPLNEQRAVVEVLRDAEDEIATAKERIFKTKAIKQGMMQELLTGRTCLPVQEAVS
jgi:type I restriction enzyme, S subunit